MEPQQASYLQITARPEQIVQHSNAEETDADALVAAAQEHG